MNEGRRRFDSQFTFEKVFLNEMNYVKNLQDLSTYEQQSG